MTKTCRIIFTLFICGLPWSAFTFSKLVNNELTDRQLVQQIYQELKTVIGDKRVNWPNIDIWGIKDRVATYTAEDNQIYIDQAAIEVCRSLAGQFESALAFIIGHELTHFYQAHEWRASGFASQYLLETKDFNQHQDHEKQADIYGGFIAYQAGYNVFALVPDLLEALYEAYQIDPNQDQVYPSLAKRKQLTAQALALSGDLINIYRAANYLTALGVYDEAYQMYAYINQSIRFKELFNNMGVCSLYQYFKISPPDFLYPLAISNHIPVTRTEGYRSEMQLLQDARQFLQRAYDYDTRYIDALLNLLVANDQAGQVKESQKLTDLLLLMKLNPSQEAKLHIISGNRYAERNMRSQAIAHYEAAIKLGATQSLTRMAKTNLRDFKRGRKVEHSPVATQIPMVNPETNGINLLTYNQFKSKIAIRPGVFFSSTDLGHSLVAIVRFNNRTFRFHWIEDPAIQVGGIGIGTSLSELLQQTGDTKLDLIENQDGQFAISYPEGLIFKIDKKGKVAEWTKFAGG